MQIPKSTRETGLPVPPELLEAPHAASATAKQVAASAIVNRPTTVIATGTLVVCTMDLGWPAASIGRLIVGAICVGSTATFTLRRMTRCSPPGWCVLRLHNR
jgi:hypothetical protein